jgi:mono/diheme cytochrome c family protein
MGKFKYKSTPLRSVPTDANLTETLINGVPGTPMPSFATLPEQEIAALVDYVKFLAMRGQYERYLMEELSNLDSGEPLVRIELADRYRQLAAIEVRDSDQSREFDDIQERYLDSMFSRVGELLDDSVSRWVDAEDDVAEIPDAPAAFSSGHPEHASFLKRGRELFHKKGNCAQCHGETGVGNGQIDSFDDWSNDWIKTPGVNPFNPQTFQEFTQAGALSPRPARPRNLTEAIYRGGGQPEKIYLRIANGIEGTPMPAAPALKPQEIWALVAFVKYLPYNDVDALDAMK